MSSTTLGYVNTQSPRAVTRSGGPRRRGFSESSQRTLIGLQKANVQLQQEMTRIEKQAHTAVSNISNHQQAMKMSWRRLETQRNMDKHQVDLYGSPNSSRKQQDSRKLRGLLASNTKLYVNTTPGAYGVAGTSVEPKDGGQAAPPTFHSSAVNQGMGDSVSVDNRAFMTGNNNAAEPMGANSSRLNHLRSSPYVTSPYVLRKKLRSPASSASASSSMRAVSNSDLELKATAPLLPSIHGSASARGSATNVSGAVRSTTPNIARRRAATVSGLRHSSPMVSFKTQSLDNSSTTSSKEVRSYVTATANGVDSDVGGERPSTTSGVNLPPISSPVPSMMVDIGSIGADKEKLMQASVMLGVSASHGPGTFKSLWSKGLGDSHSVVNVVSADEEAQMAKER